MMTTDNDYDGYDDKTHLTSLLRGLRANIRKMLKRVPDTYILSVRSYCYYSRHCCYLNRW